MTISGHSTMTPKQISQPVSIPDRFQAVTDGLSPAPEVSVVICAYTMERLPYIYEAVDSVLRQTWPPHEVILAVDHNPELFQNLNDELGDRVSVIHNDGPERGAVVTDNIGTRYATGDIIAFMDDDATAASDWLEKMVRHYRDPRVIAAGGKLVPVWQEHRPRWFAEELDWVVGGTYKGHPETQTEVRNLILCNMSVWRGVFHSAGFFTTDLGRRKNWGTGAESEFFLRVKRLSPDSTILYEPEAVVYHKVPPQRASLKYVLLRSYNEGFHKALIRRTFAGMSGEPLSMERSYLRYLVRSVLGKLVRFYKRGNTSQVASITSSVAATGAGYLMGMLKR